MLERCFLALYLITKSLEFISANYLLRCHSVDVLSLGCQEFKPFVLATQEEEQSIDEKVFTMILKGAENVTR